MCEGIVGASREAPAHEIELLKLGGDGFLLSPKGEVSRRERSGRKTGGMDVERTERGGIRKGGSPGGNVFSEAETPSG